MNKLKFIIISLTIICFFNVFKPTHQVLASSEIVSKSNSAYLIDYQTGTVLYSKDENKRLPIASMTKLMLLLLVFENVQEGNLKTDEQILVSENASGMGGSQVFLEANGKYCCLDLIKSVIIASANDASVALAERLYGSEQNCVEQMNNKAKSLGMENTLYSNCTGLTKPTQYSCAKDVAKLLVQVCNYNQYFEYSKIWMDEIDHPSGNVTGLTNTNKLVKYYSGCDGGKTGFTSEAGFCLAATAKRGGMRLVGVVIKAETSKDRFADVSNMFNYGFDNYSEKCIFEKGQILQENAKVECGNKETIKIKVKDGYYSFGRKNEKQDCFYEISLNKLKAPISQGEVVGSVSIYLNKIKCAQLDLVAAEDVRVKKVGEIIKEIVTKW